MAVITSVVRNMPIGPVAVTSYVMENLGRKSYESNEQMDAHGRVIRRTYRTILKTLHPKDSHVVTNTPYIAAYALEQTKELISVRRPDITLAE